MTDLFFGVWAIIGIGIIVRFLLPGFVLLWEWFDDVALDPILIWWEER